MRALVYYYGVELQHFSLNAISNASIFVVVCERNLGAMPHWELWLHLFGELFQAPREDKGVRKIIQAGCLHLVLKTGRIGEPHEFIPTGVMSNHAQWDS